MPRDNAEVRPDDERADAALLAVMVAGRVQGVERLRHLDRQEQCTGDQKAAEPFDLERLTELREIILEQPLFRIGCVQCERARRARVLGRGLPDQDGDEGREQRQRNPDPQQLQMLGDRIRMLAEMLAGDVDEDRENGRERGPG